MTRHRTTTSESGNNILHMAVLGTVKLSELEELYKGTLLDCLRVKNNLGLTPLDMALRINNLEALEFFLNKVGNINTVDEYGKKILELLEIKDGIIILLCASNPDLYLEKYSQFPETLSSLKDNQHIEIKRLIKLLSITRESFDPEAKSFRDYEDYKAKIIKEIEEYLKEFLSDPEKKAFQFREMERYILFFLLKQYDIDVKDFAGKVFKLFREVEQKYFREVFKKAVDIGDDKAKAEQYVDAISRMLDPRYYKVIKDIPISEYSVAWAKNPEEFNKNIDRELREFLENLFKILNQETANNPVIAIHQELIENYNKIIESYNLFIKYKYILFNEAIEEHKREINTLIEEQERKLDELKEEFNKYCNDSSNFKNKNAKFDTELYPFYKGGKYRVLLRKINKLEGNTIIFVRARDSADNLAQKLSSNGIIALEFHGGLSLNERKRVITQFKNGESRIIVSTDIEDNFFDTINIANIINYDLPSSSRNYSRRASRITKDATKGRVISLINGKSKREQNKFDELICSVHNNKNSLKDDDPHERAKIAKTSFEKLFSALKDKLSTSLNLARMISELLNPEYNIVEYHLPVTGLEDRNVFHRDREEFSSHFGNIIRSNEVPTYSYSGSTYGVCSSSWQTDAAFVAGVKFENGICDPEKKLTKNISFICVQDCIKIYKRNPSLAIKLTEAIFNTKITPPWGACMHSIILKDFCASDVANGEMTTDSTYYSRLNKEQEIIPEVAKEKALGVALVLSCLRPRIFLLDIEEYRKSYLEPFTSIPDPSHDSPEYKAISDFIKELKPEELNILKNIWGNERINTYLKEQKKGPNPSLDCVKVYNKYYTGIA